MFPAVTMHKFADTVEEETTYHEFRIVDENGTEIGYDKRASAPVIGTRHASLALATVEEYDERNASRSPSSSWHRPNPTVATRCFVS